MNKRYRTIMIAAFVAAAGGGLLALRILEPGRLLGLVGAPPRHSPESSDEARPDKSQLADSAASSSSTRLPRTIGPSGDELFEDVTSQSGVQFSYRNGQEAGQCAILESLGGGAGAFDYDGDGLLDLYLVAGGRFAPDGQILGLPNQLYRNLGNWQFEPVTAEAGVSGHGYGHGCTVGDYNNDGFPDLLVTLYDGVILYQNNGDGTFADQATAAGVTDPRWATSAAWGDFDEDGALDLFICHYVNWSFGNHPLCGEQKGIRDVCTPRLFTALGNTLYHNDGDGTFNDATRSSGIRPDGKALGVVVADLNGDGHVDIYVANDTTANHLYWNRGDGTFDEGGLASGTALGEDGVEEGSMGCDADDYDGDGRPDLWAVNYEDEPNALYRNEGGGIFTHVSTSTGLGAVSRPFVGFGTGFFDIENDGYLDLVVANGHVLYHHPGYAFRQRPLLFRNHRGLRFLDISSQGGQYFRTEHVGRGLALADLDNDGHTDLVIVHQNDPCSLLRNRSQDRNHWLRVALVGKQGNRDAVGAVLTAQVAGRRLLRLIKGGGSYLSHSDSRVLFGLGDQRQLDRLEVRWPTGRVEEITDLTGDGSLQIVEGEGAVRISDFGN